MTIKTLHNWLFSLTLIVSLISFQGYATPITKTLTTTEWIVSEHLVYETPTYYLCLTACKLKSNCFTYFSFDSLILTQEMSYALIYKVQNQIALILENLNSISQLKLISPVNTDVFIITS